MIPQSKMPVDPFTRLREENHELRERNTKLFNDTCDMYFAIAILTGYFPPFNEHVRKRGRDYLDKLKAEWFSKHPELVQ